MTRGPSKKHGTNKSPPTGRVQERSKGDATYSATSQNPPLWHPSWLSNVCTSRKDPESEQFGQRQLRNQSHPHKTRACEPCGRAVLLGSLTLLLSTGVLVPNKISCFVSTRVSLDNSFLSVRQEPSFGAWKRSPFLQHLYYFEI